jgi:hypothetical protein
LKLTLSDVLARERLFSEDITGETLAGYSPDPKASQVWVTEDSVYALYKTATSWTTAKKNAETVGGHLAILETSQESADLYERLSNLLSPADLAKTVAKDGGGSSYVWLGASDSAAGVIGASEGNWRWVNGTPVGLNNERWGSGDLGMEPDNFSSSQHMLAMGMQNWPSGFSSGSGYGDAGFWNDVSGTNSLYYVVEWNIV